MRTDNYFVYILANQRNTVLYVGATKDLAQRIARHEKGPSHDFAHRDAALK